MGEPVVFAFLTLAALGLLLVLGGAVKQRRGLWASGGALWLALIGAWVIGPIGLMLGLPLLLLAIWPARRRP
jgi:hypothetical protein